MLKTIFKNINKYINNRNNIYKKLFNIINDKKVLSLKILDQNETKLNNIIELKHNQTYFIYYGSKNNKTFKSDTIYF